jgi:error-prone DNA polymerase
MHHGVEVLGPDVNEARKDCTLEPRTAGAGPVGHPRPGWHADPSMRAVRMGLRYVRGLADALLDRIDAERERAPFTDLEGFTRRTGAPTDAIEALSTAGAFGSLGQTRRSALWAAGALRDARPDNLPGLVTGVDAPPLPGMTEVEETAADLWATGLTAGRHPVEFVRDRLSDRGVVTIDALRTLPHRSVVEVAGIVTHRQRPSTANGIIFVNLEDETGLLNVICTPHVWRRFRKVARMSPALRVRGMLERYQGVINVVASRIEELPLRAGDLVRSRDFH